MRTRYGRPHGFGPGFPFGREYREYGPVGPWSGLAERTGDLAVAWRETARLGNALSQVIQTGSPDQIDKANRLVDDTRRRLYALLAEGPGTAVKENPDGTSEEK